MISTLGGMTLYVRPWPEDWRQDVRRVGSHPPADVPSPLHLSWTKLALRVYSSEWTVSIIKTIVGRQDIKVRLGPLG